MTPVKIDGDTTPIGPPKGWDEATMGRCATIHVRVDEIDGLRFLRTAWEPSPAELARMIAGGKLILGVAAHAHPVVNFDVGEAPDSDQPAMLARHVLLSDLTPGVRVEMIYPGDRRCFATAPLVDGKFADSVAVAIASCEELAEREGWTTNAGT